MFRYVLEGILFMKTIITFLFLPLLISNSQGINKVSQKTSSLIDAKNDFVAALTNAKDGDTLLVGDIDFQMEPQLAKSFSRIVLSKSVHIKNGKKDGFATFKNGSFNVEGTKVSGESTSVSFEGIKFDGLIEGSKLNDSSWEYDDPNDVEPKWAQYAMTYKGNVNASYSNCMFTNYASENGGALNAFYGDYKGNETILSIYGDNSSCKLNIDIDGCSFESNYSYYVGGALFIDGSKKNVSVNIDDSSFTGNKTGSVDYCIGGGAGYFYESDVKINHSTFKDNVGSYCYGKTIRECADIPDGMPQEFLEEYLSSVHDSSYGGALRLGNSSLDITDCNFLNNISTNGGALYLNNVKTTIDGCVFSENEATNDVLKKSTSDVDKGPWSSQGLGGAIYNDSYDGIKLDIINSSFYSNVARNGYGSVYSSYNNGVGSDVSIDPEINIYLSSFYDNKVTTAYPDTSEHPWGEIPGNVWEIPFINTYASIVIDENNKTKIEAPSKENHYCVFGQDNKNVSFEIKNNLHLNPIAKDISLELPDGYINELLGDRYESNNGKFVIGDNYSPKLYKENESMNMTFVIWLSIALGVLLGVAIFLFYELKKRKQSSKVNEEEQAAATNISFETEEILRKITEEHNITEREQDVLRLLLEGKKRQDIAKKLFLSESSIKKYTSSIYSKIGVHSKIELIMKYKK